MRVSILFASIWITFCIQAANQPPTIEHEPHDCTAERRRARLCAEVSDDSGVGDVRLVFRVNGTRGYYWTPMSFDGSRYCAWLPAPIPKTRSIEYYVEAFDDAYESSRTRSFDLSVRDDCEMADQDVPVKSAIVGRASPSIAHEPPGFDPATYEPMP